MSVYTTDKPCLLVITSTFPRWQEDNEPGFVYELCKRLVSKYRLIVLAPAAYGARTRENMDGIEVVRFRYFLDGWQRLAYEGGIMSKLRMNPLNMLLVPFFLLAQLVVLLRISRVEKVDLIHAHWIIPQGLVAWIAAKCFGVKTPLLCTSHGGDLFGLQGRVLSWLKRKVLNSCNGITVVSNSMQELLVKNGIPSSSIKVISMGVDLVNTFVPSGKHKRKDNEILFVGRLVKKKGVSDLIYAFASVLEEFPDGHLTIIGGGPERDNLEDVARELNISDRLSFTGPQATENLVSYYQVASVAVFPFIITDDGDQEGLGLVVIESLGCECPVIVSDLAVVRDVIRDAENGMLVRPGDRPGLANAIKSVFRDKQYPLSMARQGRQDVLNRYDWDIIADRYSEYIAELLASKIPE